MKSTKKERWLNSLWLSIFTNIAIVLFFHFVIEDLQEFFFLAIIVMLVIGVVPFMLIYRLIFALIAHSMRNVRITPLEDLPVEVKSLEDIEALLRGIDQPLGNRNEFENALKHINAGERLYFACRPVVDIKEAGRNSVRVFCERAVVFISEKRVIIIRKNDEVFEFPFEDIHSVIGKNGMSFCTSKHYIDFNVTQSRDAAKVKAIIIRVIEATQNIVQINSVKAVTCPGCGATVLVRLGNVAQCDYCNRFVDKDIPL